MGLTPCEDACRGPVGSFQLRHVSDPLKDFDPVTIIGKAPVFLMVNPKIEARTATEFVALCKRQPGKINFGSGSSSTRISGELLKAKAGIDIVHVPYKSTPLALQDTMSGHVQMCFTDPVTGLPQVKAGTVRCLGVGHARATGEVATERLPRPRVVLLREVAEPGGLGQYRIDARLSDAGEGDFSLAEPHFVPQALCELGDVGVGVRVAGTAPDDNEQALGAWDGRSDPVGRRSQQPWADRKIAS